MLCPKCRRGTRVLDSRENAHSVRRKRECTVYGYRFTTQEDALDALSVYIDGSAIAKVVMDSVRKIEAEIAQIRATIK